MAGSIPETVGNCPKQWSGAAEKLKHFRPILVNEVGPKISCREKVHKKMNTKRKQPQAILYARVSTKHQEQHGFRLSKQFDDMRAYAAQNGFQVFAEFQEAYSGTVPFRNRPFGAKVYEAIEAGKIDAVIVHELDRAARGDTSYEMPIDFLVFWRDLQEADVELHSCDEGLVKDGIVTLVEAWQSNEDNRKRRKRSMQGRREKINKGYFPGNGPRCYGYEIVGNKKDTRLEIYEKEAEIVRLIFNWYAHQRLGVTEICRRLTEMRVLSYGDKHNKGKKRGTGEWTPGQIYSILKRETYRGVWYAYRYKMVKIKGERHKKRVSRPKSEHVAIAVPAIIDDETWEKAQAYLKRGRQMSRRNNKSHEYLLARRAKCRCGYHIQGKPCHARGKIYLYYRCNGKYNDRTVGECNLSLFRVEKVDAAVWAWVFSLITDPERMLKGWRDSQQEAQTANAPLLHELKQVKLLLEENEVGAKKLVDLYLAGKFDMKILDDKKAELDKLIHDLKIRKDEIEQVVVQRTVSDEEITDFMKYAESISGYLNGEVDFEIKRQVLELLDLTAIFSEEEDGQIIYVTCHIGKERLSVNNPLDCSCPNQSRWW
ncbi:MAG: recombinase family protein [Anaerolineaceae bacterium]|nr:recombinase family protein [Anaerolineaceae bacterium]